MVFKCFFLSSTKSVILLYSAAITGSRLLYLKFSLFYNLVAWPEVCALRSLWTYLLISHYISTLSLSSSIFWNPLTNLSFAMCTFCISFYWLYFIWYEFFAGSFVWYWLFYWLFSKSLIGNFGGEYTLDSPLYIYLGAKLNAYYAWLLISSTIWTLMSAFKIYFELLGLVIELSLFTSLSLILIS